MITRFDQLDLSKTYSYADYLTWKFQERVELIAGRIFRMSPGPSRRHQKVSLEISRQLANHLLNHKCEAFAAPFDVRFTEEDGAGDTSISNTVQPDICVVCDPSKLDDKGCLGAPDLIIEILSPTSATRDLKHKFELYQKFGVQEYWILDPYNQTIIINLLDEDCQYKSIRPYIYNTPIASHTITGFSIDLSTIFVEDPDEPALWAERKELYQRSSSSN